MCSTSVLPRRGAVVLVSGGPALSGPAALVALAAASVPAAGRRAEHGALGPADVFRQAALSVLLGGAALGGLSALDDQAIAGVIMWVLGSIGISAAAVLDRRSAAVRRFAADGAIEPAPSLPAIKTPAHAAAFRQRRPSPSRL